MKLSFRGVKTTNQAKATPGQPSQGPRPERIRPSGVKSAYLKRNLSKTVRSNPPPDKSKSKPSKKGNMDSSDQEEDDDGDKDNDNSNYKIGKRIGKISKDEKLYVTEFFNNLEKYMKEHPNSESVKLKVIENNLRNTTAKKCEERNEIWICLDPTRQTYCSSIIKFMCIIPNNEGKRKKYTFNAAISPQRRACTGNLMVKIMNYEEEPWKYFHVEKIFRGNKVKDTSKASSDSSSSSSDESSEQSSDEEEPSKQSSDESSNKRQRLDQYKVLERAAEMLLLDEKEVKKVYELVKNERIVPQLMERIQSQDREAARNKLYSKILADFNTDYEYRCDIIHGFVHSETSNSVKRKIEEEIEHEFRMDMADAFSTDREFKMACLKDLREVLPLEIENGMKELIEREMKETWRKEWQEEYKNRTEGEKRVERIQNKMQNPKIPKTTIQGPALPHEEKLIKDALEDLLDGL